MGIETLSVNDLYDQTVRKFSLKIMRDHFHPLYNKYVWLCSRRKLNFMSLRTNHLKILLCRTVLNCSIIGPLEENKNYQCIRNFTEAVKIVNSSIYL